MLVLLVLMILTTAASGQTSKPATITFQCEHAPPDAVVAITSVSDPIEWKEVTLDSAPIRSRESVALVCNVDEPTTAELHIGEQYAKLFLEPGMHLTISVDYDAFDSTLTFEGDGAANQRYLLRELLHDFQTPQTKYTLFTDAAAYRRYIDSVQNSHRDFYHTSDTLAMTPSFRRYAASVIEYQYVYPLDMFSVIYDPATQQFSDRELPDWFFSGVRSLPLNDMVMAADPDYITAVDIYLQRFVLRNTTDLHTICRKIDSTLTGRVRDVQLGAMLRRNMSELVQNESLGDSLVAAYEATCASLQLSQVLRAQYNIGCTLRRGRPVPIFTVVDNNGAEHTLQELKSKVVYLDIWATWCLPCVAAMKAARELRSQFDTNDVGKHWWAANAERSASLKKLFGVYGIPRYLIIDRDGNIHSAEAPGPDNVKTTLQELVERK